jgi:ABC-2 type transport system ATP-binding protein
MTKPAILVQNLIRDFDTVRAIDDISLEVQRGTNFGILGPKNAGKTTFIRLLLGQIGSTGGQIEILGLDPREQNKEIYRRTGILLNPPDLYDSLSALDNMDFFAWSRSISSKDRQDRVYELLKHFDIWERRNESIEKWDRESRLRLGLAVAFLHQPNLVILDEPTAGLNSSAATEIREKLASLISFSRTSLILATENPSEIKRLCEEMAMIQNGRLIATGKIDEFDLQSGRVRMTIKGQGLTEQLLTILAEQTEVAAASLQDQQMIIDLAQDADPAAVTEQIAQNGGTIEDIYWSETVSEKS